MCPPNRLEGSSPLLLAAVYHLVIAWWIFVTKLKKQRKNEQSPFTAWSVVVLTCHDVWPGNRPHRSLVPKIQGWANLKRKDGLTVW